MRALVLQDWWKIAVTEVPDPVLGADEVLIQVLATGICGSDLHGYTWESGRREVGQVMGHETVGRIAALGADVDSTAGVAVGALATVNPVIGCGACERCVAGSPHACAHKTVIGVTPVRTAAFAELLAAPAANVVPLPTDTPVELGALVEPLAVGLHAARRAPVRAGDAVLVVGGGPIGQACALAALQEGVRAVAVSEPVAGRRDVSRALGASVVNPHVDDLPSAVSDCLTSLPDVVIDAVGSSQTLREALACAQPAAPVVLVGMATPDVCLAAYDVSTHERSIVGSFSYTPSEFRETAEWVGTNPAGLGRIVDGRVGLDDAPAAFGRLGTGEWQASKVLVFLERVDGQDRP